ncbi:kinase-like protein [Lojkania enalia]|uniref:Kinase-like protein n=1 Tax=Lojkania enalia TaxID=147567 RepID=A0A9P4K5F1_9PLEO|nr:kinase-like protein [Didymosphaeria enalia]
MSRFAPLLLSALAVTPFVNSIAVPNQLHSVSRKTLKVREPITFPTPVQVGDLVSFQNGQLLRRDNETSPFEVFALESRSDFLERDVTVKRADPVWDPPLADIDPEDYEDYAIVKCGDLGHVKVGDKIGGGGSGTIYKAIKEDNTFIAMKAVNNEKERDLEWDLMQKVGDNPNIVKLHARCKLGTNYYIAMDLVDGESLQLRINSKVYSKLEAEAPVKLVMGQIFNAIEQAHSKGVAHCDIKGDNVLMSIGEADKATVIDFGMATTETKVKDINVAGGIRAPEVENHSTEEIDPKANDVWELGTLLVSLLIGKKPWTDSNAANAKAIWSKAAPTQRKDACKKEWPEFTDDFCDILADIFAQQLSRKPLETVAARIINPNLKIFDECEKNKKTTKREAAAGEMVVTNVIEMGEELVVRAMMY